MNGFDYSGKTVLVTGGTKGIGRRIAERFLAAGARVFVCGRSAPDTPPSAGGRTATFVAADLRDIEQVDAMLATIRAAAGRLDVLVNNAAICPVGSIEDTSLDTWRRVMRTNADGYFLGCKYAIGAMKGNDTPGSIVMMSSVAALGGLPMMCAYTGSKGAVTALARSVAVHCKRSGYRIRCNSIHPDGIWTPMTQALMPDLDPAALGIGSDPMARMCDPQDVANLVLFLASDESRFVNGAELRIDNAQLVSSL